MMNHITIAARATPKDGAPSAGVRVTLMKWLTIFQFIIFSMISGCASYAEHDSVEKGDIHEALIYYVLDSGFDSLGKAKHLFVSIDGEDPSVEFIERFRNYRYKVLPVSYSKYDEQSGMVIHRSKDGTAAVLQIRTLKVFSEKKVKIDWGHYKANLNASGSTATLKYKNGKWLVVKSRMKWIS